MTFGNQQHVPSRCADFLHCRQHCLYTKRHKFRVEIIETNGKPIGVYGCQFGTLLQIYQTIKRHGMLLPLIAEQCSIEGIASRRHLSKIGIGSLRGRKDEGQACNPMMFGRFMAIVTSGALLSVNRPTKKTRTLNTHFRIPKQPVSQAFTD